MAKRKTATYFFHEYKSSIDLQDAISKYIERKESDKNIKKFKVISVSLVSRAVSTTVGKTLYWSALMTYSYKTKGENNG